MQSKILITGGGGYLGAHIALSVKEVGYQPVIIDNMSSGSEKNILAEYEFIKTDISDVKTLEKIMADNVVAVIHTAAVKKAGESMHNPGVYAKYNIADAILLLNSAIKAGINIFIFTSSAAVYGSYEYLPIDENHPCKPENFYGYTKKTFEDILIWYNKLLGIKFGILRCFNIAGYDKKMRLGDLEKDSQNIIPVLMDVIFKKKNTFSLFGDDYDTVDGSCVRDYIHASDIASAHVKAVEYLKQDNATSFICNLGCQQGYSNIEILDAVKKITKSNFPVKIAPRRKGDVASLYASNKLAAKLLNWQPINSDINNIIQSSYNFYKKILAD